MFDGTAINISTEGHKHLGALLRSRKDLEDYVEEKVEDWISQIVRLAEFTQSHLQASSVAYTFGLRHRWTYFLRTLPNIKDLRKPLECTMSDVLIPLMGDHKCTELERDILSLPVRLRGLGFMNPTQIGNAEFQASVNVTAPLAEQIMSELREPPEEAEIRLLQQKANKEKEERLLKLWDEWRNSLPARTKRAVSLAGEKGASN